MDAIQAAEGVSNLAKQYRSVLALADYLKQVGSIDCATTAAQAHLDALRKEESLALATTDAARATLAIVDQQLDEATTKLRDTEAITQRRQQQLDALNEAVANLRAQLAP